MKKYHKINSIYKRDLGGTNKLIIGDWSLPEFEFLQNAQWEFTEKVDGTNIRIILQHGEGMGHPHLYVGIRGRTDNANVPNALKDAITDLTMTDQFLYANNIMVERGIDQMTLYGEGYGPGIQGGGKYRDTPGFVLFDVRVGGEWWLDRGACEDIAERLGLEIVPVLAHGPLSLGVSLCSNGGFNSTWGDFTAEGVVARPSVPLFNRKMERIIAKIKVRDF